MQAIPKTRNLFDRYCKQLRIFCERIDDRRATKGIRAIPKSICVAYGKQASFSGKIPLGVVPFGGKREDLIGT